MGRPVPPTLSYTMRPLACVGGIAEDFRLLGQVLVAPSAWEVVYPPLSRTLKRAGFVAATAAAAWQAPEMGWQWTAAAALTTGTVTRLAMTLAEDVVGLSAAAVATTATYHLSGNKQQNPAQASQIKLRRSLAAGVIALAAGGLTGLVGGGKLTYDYTQPRISHFVQKHRVASQG